MKAVKGWQTSVHKTKWAQKIEIILCVPVLCSNDGQFVSFTIRLLTCEQLKILFIRRPQCIK